MHTEDGTLPWGEEKDRARLQRITWIVNLREERKEGEYYFVLDHGLAIIKYSA